MPLSQVNDLISHIVTKCPHLRFRGLMSMGAIGNTKEFLAMHALKTSILSGSLPIDISEQDFVLSMGTSQDYEAAVVEGGATQVRLGTTIFGKRNYK